MLCILMLYLLNKVNLDSIVRVKFFCRSSIFLIQTKAFPHTSPKQNIYMKQ